MCNYNQISAKLDSKAKKSLEIEHQKFKAQSNIYLAYVIWYDLSEGIRSILLNQRVLFLAIVMLVTIFGRWLCVADYVGDLFNVENLWQTSQFGHLWQSAISMPTFSDLYIDRKICIIYGQMPFVEKTCSKHHNISRKWFISYNIE